MSAKRRPAFLLLGLMSLAIGVGIAIYFAMWGVPASNVVATPGNSPSAVATPGNSPQPNAPLSDDYTWDTITYLQNMGNATANVVISQYEPSTPVRTTTTIIAPGSMDTFVLTGSVVLSADQPTTSLMIWKGTNAQNKTIRYSYTGTTNGGQALYYPIVKNNYYGMSTWFSVQNSSATASTVTATFTMLDNSVYMYTSPPIAPGESIAIQPGDAGVPESSSNGRANIGSAIIRSNNPNGGSLAGVWFEEAAKTKGNFVSILAALTSMDSTTKAYVAERSISDDVISFYIFNVESKPIDVDIKYGTTSTGRGDCSGQTYTGQLKNILPKRSRIFTQQVLPKTHNGCYRWATIEGTGEFVAVASESSSVSQGATKIIYQVRPIDSFTKDLAVPLFLDQYGGVSSSFQIRNTDTTTLTNLTVTFHCVDGNNKTYTATTRPLQIAPNGVFAFYRPSTMSGIFTDEQAFILNSRCSAIAHGDQPLAGFVSEKTDDPNIASWVNYDAINFK